MTAGCAGRSMTPEHGLSVLGGRRAAPSVDYGGGSMLTPDYARYETKSSGCPMISDPISNTRIEHWGDFRWGYSQWALHTPKDLKPYIKKAIKANGYTVAELYTGQLRARLVYNSLVEHGFNTSAKQLVDWINQRVEGMRAERRQSGRRGQQASTIKRMENDAKRNGAELRLRKRQRPQ